MDSRADAWKNAALHDPRSATSMLWVELLKPLLGEVSLPCSCIYR